MKLFVDTLTAEGRFAVTTDLEKVELNIDIIPEFRNALQMQIAQGNTYPKFVTGLGRWVFVYIAEREAKAMVFFDVRHPLDAKQVKKLLTRDIYKDVMKMREKYIKMYTPDMDYVEVTLEKP